MPPFVHSGGWNSSTLRDPFLRIHWAGTETSTEWYGYMEGALASSERVVEELKEKLLKSKEISKL